MTRRQAEKLAQARGWSIAEDGKGWRRVVASPRPMQILEARVIELLVSQGVTVICAGGGGIPVLERSDGTLVGVEAVIDKDLASALLARQLRADQLLLLTDVDGVYLNWGTDAAKAIRQAEARALNPSDFAPGSMRPKIEAAIGFAAETGRPASIGRLEDAADIIAGAAGTRIDVATKGIVLRAMRGWEPTGFDMSHLLETNLRAVQLLEHVVVEHFHQRANAGGLLQPAILQLCPDVGERSSETLCVGDLMHALIESRSLPLPDDQFDLHGFTSIKSD